MSTAGIKKCNVYIIDSGAVTKKAMRNIKKQNDELPIVGVSFRCFLTFLCV